MSTIVTGANRGIGLELTRQLVQAGKPVIAACRTASPELKALGVRIEQLDVADEASVEAFAKRIDEPVTVLVHNAGVLSNESLNDFDSDRVRRQFEVNALGPLRLTQALKGSLQQGSKVAIVTSRMGSVADNTSGGMYGYRMSKAAVNAAGKSLACDLAPAGVSVVLLHPGFVRTGMTGGQGLVDASESASGLLARIDELTLESTGTFVHMNGDALPW